VLRVILYHRGPAKPSSEVLRARAPAGRVVGCLQYFTAISVWAVPPSQTKKES
jgi:hypothetical protein